MKRTVKAWVVLNSDTGHLPHSLGQQSGPLAPMSMNGLAVYGSKKAAKWRAMGVQRVYPCALTYDDGKPRRARRAGRAR